MNLTDEDRELLEKNGWIITCESPFEIEHPDGSSATTLAAEYAVLGILSDLKADLELTLANADCKPTSAYELYQRTAEKLNRAVTIAQLEDTDDAWETAYDLVFSKTGNRVISQCLAALDVSFADYYDPDTSYQEDVLAYVEALNKTTLKLEKFATALPDANVVIAF